MSSGLFASIISGTHLFVLGPINDNSFANFPSEWRCEDKIPLFLFSSLEITAAPAPSPKITVTALPLVEKSKPPE